MSLVVESAADLLPWVRGELRMARQAYKKLLLAIPEEFRHWCTPEKAPGIGSKLARQIERARMDRLAAKRRYISALRTANGETTVGHLKHALCCPAGG